MDVSIKRKYKLFRFNSYLKNIKFRSKGLFVQVIRKASRFLGLEITWIIKKEYSKRKVYTYIHKKKYEYKKPTLVQKLKSELKQVLKK